MLRTRSLSSDWLKSPRRSSSVGTVRTIESGRLSFQRSNEVNVKILFLLIGPPKVAPYTLSSLPRNAFVS